MGFLQNWVDQPQEDTKQLATAAKRLFVLAYLLLFLAFLQFLFALSRRDDPLAMTFVALWFVMATTNFVLAELYRERYQRIAHEEASALDSLSTMQRGDSDHESQGTRRDPGSPPGCAPHTTEKNETVPGRLA
jgi:hypothetical protein